MNEIEEVVILAAGSSKRMGDLTKDKSKCLLLYKNKMILERMINQLKKYNIKKIIIIIGYKKEKIIKQLKKINGIEIEIIRNNKYKKDVNIYSMLLTLNKLKGPTVIFEADIVMEDELVNYVIGSDFEKKSVWFTCGDFKKGQNGGILKTDEFGNVTAIKIVEGYKPEYKGYKKLMGIMRVNSKDLPTFKKLVKKYASRTIKQYYLIPWIENLKVLPAIEGCTENYLFKSFNTPEDYKKCLEIDFDKVTAKEKEIEFREVNKLKHIEGYDENRVRSLLEKIKKDKIWTKPIYIEKTHNLVLDGQHRLEVAKLLDLKYVPVQAFDYHDVKVWTLRKEEKVTTLSVIERANAGRIYPYKTVKHKFPNVVSKCKIKINDLKEKKGD